MAKKATKEEVDKAFNIMDNVYSKIKSRMEELKNDPEFMSEVSKEVKENLG